MGKREGERAELFSTIWKVANDLRGSIDGWDFKNYVLGMMFYRYISENISSYIEKGEHDAGDVDFRYAKLSDSDISDGIRKEIINDKGFFIYPSQLFSNVLENAPGDDNLNMTLETVFRSIEESAVGTESEKNVKGLFDDIDVNSLKLGKTVQKRNAALTKLMVTISEMDLGDISESSIDVFGDAYEFLMGKYASEAGKGGGEFYTPPEVSILLTRLASYGKSVVNKVYDPACGSGSLLLKSLKIIGKENVKVGFFGQEKNLTTYNLCRINMFLHDVGYDKFDIAHGDTLIEPLHTDDEPFEVIVSNPPYSIKWEGKSNPVLINDPRYSPAGVLAPESKADMAFIMHSLSWLATNGTAAIVCFPGIMYRSGAEKQIRQYLIDNNYVDCIIELPKDLFYGTSIVTDILVLKKSKMDSSVLFIDASKQFSKAEKGNKLTEDNINHIMNLYCERKDVDYESHLVTNEEIGSRGYRLSVSSFVRKEDVREVVDIDELNSEIDGIVECINSLRAELNQIISEIEGW